MLSNDTCEKLKGLGLESFLKGIEEQRQVSSYDEMAFEERFSMLIDFVYKDRMNLKLKRLINQAKFRFKEADGNSIIYENRSLDRGQVLNLLTCQFLETYTNIILVGFTGSGKTYLACAIGKAACRHGYRVYYIRLGVLFEQMAAAMETSTGLGRLLSRLSKYDLLIIDEWASLSLNPEQAHFIFELVERRYGLHSTLLCTQHPVKEWHTSFGGNATAESILDRIIQNSITVFTGETNMRQLLSPHPPRPEQET